MVRRGSAAAVNQRRGACDLAVTEERKWIMDARNVRIGETGLEQLIQWLRQNGRPQSLEALTQQYLVILKELVRVEEEA